MSEKGPSLNAAMLNLVRDGMRTLEVLMYTSIPMQALIRTEFNCYRDVTEWRREGDTSMRTSSRRLSGSSPTTAPETI